MGNKKQKKRNYWTEAPHMRKSILLFSGNSQQESQIRNRSQINSRLCTVTLRAIAKGCHCCKRKAEQNGSTRRYVQSSGAVTVANAKLNTMDQLDAMYHHTSRTCRIFLSSKDLVFLRSLTVRFSPPKTGQWGSVETLSFCMISARMRVLCVSSS